jgi:hypothetical protein
MCVIYFTCGETWNRKYINNSQTSEALQIEVQYVVLEVTGEGELPNICYKICEIMFLDNGKHHFQQPL